MAFDPRALLSFVATARAGSISRAAALLERTQPALSQQLRRLEAQAGRPLMTRTTRGISLTSAGEAFLPYAERMLALDAEAQAALASAPRDLTGRCGIGLLEDLVDMTLPAMLTDLLRMHPGMELEVLVAPGKQMREAFDAGRIQLLLGDPAYMAPLTPQWRRSLRPRWIAAQAFRLTDPLPLILFSRPCRWREPLLESLTRAGVRWRVAFESSSLNAVHGAVRNGIGIASLLPVTQPPGTTDLEGQLPAAPDVEVGLFLREDARSRDFAALLADSLVRHVSSFWRHV